MKEKIIQTDGKLGVRDTISMATGFAIGSGVITMTGIAIGMTGRSVIISYLLTAATFLLAVIPTLIISSIHPSKSASYVYSKELLHPKVGGFYMFIYFLGRLTISIFGISFAQYLAALIPGVNERLVAVLVLTLFFVINLFGMKSAARAQNIMFYILVLSLGIFIVAGFLKLDVAAYFNLDGFFVDGFHGVWSAASLLVFAVGGAGVLVDFGNSVRNPAKVIPKVIVGVTVCVALAYALLSMVAAGVLPYDQVAFKPLTSAAAAVFGQGSGMYALFIVGGALLALATTLNSSFVWYSSAMQKGCEEGWFPKALVKPNRYGVSYRLMIIFYLFGLVPALIGFDITVLSKMAVGLTTFMWMIPVFGLVNAPKRYEAEWKASKFAKLPTWSLWALSILSFVIYGSQTIALFQGNPTASNIIIVVYVILVTLYILLLRNYPGKESTGARQGNGQAGPVLPGK